LRPATPADRDFVERTYFDTQRWLIEELFGWRGDEVERAKFAEFYNEAETRIIVQDGNDAGWITVERDQRSIRLESIYIVATRQRRGIGTLLTRKIMEDAAAAKLPVTLSTAKINPARHLYERLGFVTVGEDRYKVYMELGPTRP